MQNTGLRPRVPKGYSLIVTAFDITPKLTQQVSKNCRQTRRFSERARRKGQKNAYRPETRTYLILLRFFDIFKPVNAV